ncbi:hypothetical protein V1264_005540 [Littorina saxatilis]
MTSVRSVNCTGHGGSNGGPSNIAFISITTDDLDASLKFYTQVLGGMQAKEFSFRYHGNTHYELMFQRELLEAREKGVDPGTLGVPDIRSSGTHEVRGEMVVFDNGIIQLIQFVPRYDIARPSSSLSPAFQAHETRTSPAYIAAPHVCFWVQDDVDFNDYIRQLENRSANLGLTQVKVNRPVEVHSEAQRQAVDKNHLGLTFETGDFAGLSFAYFKGPRGEQLELYRIRNQTRHNLGRDFCKRGAISTAFVDDYQDNQWKKDVGLSAKLFGLMQFGTRTDDLWRSVNFYVNMLGADLVERPLQGTNIRGDNVQYMLFQKELLDAEHLRVRPRDIGVADISNRGNMRLDHRFSLFDNFVVETLLYTDGRTLGEPAFNPRVNHSSLAYINDMYVALMVRDDLDFPTQLEILDRDLAKNGFDKHVRVNRIPDENRGGYYTFSQGPLSGMTYSMLSGPAGEHVALVQFRGVSRDKLRRALLQYGAVSSAFADTNPRLSGRMAKSCRQFLGYDIDSLIGK